MTHFGQLGSDEVVQARFEIQGVGFLRVGEARGVAGGLWVGAQVDYVDEYLRMACACWLPPMSPKAMTGWPSFMRNPGNRVWNGRLCGAMMLGLLGSSENSAPRLFNRTVARHGDAGAEGVIDAVDE